MQHKHFSFLRMLFVVVLAATVGLVNAQQLVLLNNSGATEADVDLTASSHNKTVLTFQLNSYSLTPVSTPRGEAFTVSTNGGARLLEKGAPDVVKLTESIIIPNTDKMQLEVVGSEYIELNDIEIAPSKGLLYRDTDPAQVPYTYGRSYNENQFFPQQLASLNTPYIARDYRGQTVVVNPFRYNPVTKTLRIYTSVTVSVSSTGLTGANPLVSARSTQSIDPVFGSVYRDHFINYATFSRYTPLEEQGSMLIISHSDYMDAMAPYIEWKTMKGLQVEMIDVSEAGSNSTAIKNYISDYYDNNNLAYVLFVGDAQHIPVITGGVGGDSDNAYGYLEGSDHYQEVFVGRFSAESVADVETQVQRTLDYEKAQFGNSGEWLATNLGLSSDQGPGDDNEYDYEHIRNMQTDLTGFTYTTMVEMFDGSQGGLDQPGSPTPTMVSAQLNGDGAGSILYTGHGSDNSFVSSGFSSSNVNTLQNAGQLPFIWSVACVNGNFVGQTCFAEAWLRATDASDNPTGAVAVLMSTINQSWNPPMEGQDEMVDILVESYDDNIKRTFAGISINGCFQMNDTYGSGGDEMTDTWTLFGDPELMVRTATPEEMTVSHNPAIFIGNDQFQVSCDMDGALVALSSDGVLKGTGIVEGGMATITIEPFTDVGILDVVVTAFNQVPYIGEAEVIPAEGPFVTLKEFAVNDSEGNNNGQADYGEEEVALDLTLKNVGVEIAQGVEATITTSDEYITLIEDTYTFGDIGIDVTTDPTTAFSFSIASDVPDQHKASFDISFTDTESNVWSTTIQVPLCAPVITSAMAGINDEGALSFSSSPVTYIRWGYEYIYDIEVMEASGNANGTLDPGETLEVLFDVSNIGHSTSPAVLCDLTTDSEYATINTATVNLGGIDADATEQASFTVSIDEATPIGEAIDFVLNISFGEYNQTITLTLKVGLIIEDFETGDFSSYAWEFGGDGDWEITTAAPYEGTYAAGSVDIADSQTAELSITMDVLAEDVVTFFKKVSSENNYDYLRFYIDGTQMGEWCGEVDWSEESFNVTTGTHTLTWSYEKDYIVSSGQDCAWVDFINLPPHTAKSVTSGITVASENLPAWLTLTDNGDGTAQLNGQPEEGDVGQHSITLTAEDESGNTADQTFDLTVDIQNTIGDLAVENSLSIYPNPVQTMGNVGFDLDENATVSISLFNVIGEEMVSILSNEEFVSGTHNVQFNSNELTSGIYMLRITVNGQNFTKRIVVTR